MARECMQEWIHQKCVLFCVTIFLCGTSLSWASAGGPPFPALILFGDSTIDVGTNNHVQTLVRSDFPPYGRDFYDAAPTGRFTNGLMVADFIAIKLGLPISLPYLDPGATGDRILQGINFASAASGLLPSTSRLLNVIPASKQLELFKDYQIKVAKLVGQQKASSIISEALFVISTGSNDYILNYYLDPLIQKQFTIMQFSSLLLSKHTEFMQQLYQAGARNILIFGFPAFGCLPAQITAFGSIGQKTCIEYMNEVAKAYNNNLQDAISKLQSNLSGVSILYEDSFTFLYDAFNNPSKYGFTETRRACCGEGYIATAAFCNPLSRGTCPDASTYLFFDSLHPTQTLYKYVADAAYDSVVSFFQLQNRNSQSSNENRN